MSEHHVTVSWERTTDDFDYDTYSRSHTWEFEGGHVVPASSAPGFLGTAERVDPEEAFLAALSSCHMLTFLAIAAKKRLVVDDYLDQAVGHLEKNEDGKLAMTRVELHPAVKFGGEPPSAETIEKMHHKAHENCFIALSVKTDVTVEPAS
jgi:organic hydroperoxide reductase OsmC/OhrA